MQVGFGLGRLTAPLRDLGLGSRFRDYRARSSTLPRRIEFTLRSLPEPRHYGLTVHVQLLSTVGLRRRSYFPLQAG